MVQHLNAAPETRRHGAAAGAGARVVARAAWHGGCTASGVTGHQTGALHPPRVPALSIRDLGEEDLPGVQRIYAYHVLHGLATFEEIPPPTAELARRCAAILECGLPCLAANIGGELVGYAYASPYRPRSAYRCTIEDSVYVAHHLAGRGIGSALLETLIARCESGPWRQMLAVIGDRGNAASVALHKRCGFATVGTFTSVGFKLGRWVDTVLMQRPLGAGDVRPPG
jgi:L-amino acid N-acyltransferase YncA